MSGDIVGPVAGACTSWNYSDPPEIGTPTYLSRYNTSRNADIFLNVFVTKTNSLKIGVLVLASIILAFLGFMFILDAISAIRYAWL